MELKLYYNPISSYSQKTLMGLYEKEVSFTPIVVNLMDPVARQEYLAVNPWGKVPTMICVDEDRTLPESSIILEFIDQRFSTGSKLFPNDPDQCRRARLFDRMSDFYLNDPTVTIFLDQIRPPEAKNPAAVARAKQTLETSVRVMNEHYATRTWALGEEFSIADVSAAPALFYMQQVYPFADFPHLVAYAQRVIGRPSYQKVLSEALPVLQQMAQKRN
ncbi:MAG: glutathione S-transferase family protein [Myxococcales bacterium]|nr:glutathione S-transferase family protein [Myxococcales bacterium]